MKLKHVGYVLTILVALWGLVYVPLRSIQAVKPYTAHPFAVLDYYPLTPILVIPIAASALWLGGKMKSRSEEGMINVFSWKPAFLFVLWVVAPFWALVNTDAKERFLHDQRTWAGSCTISDVYASEMDGHPLVVRLKCTNGTMTHTLDNMLVNQLMRGKSLTCTTNAMGSADCHP